MSLSLSELASKLSDIVESVPLTKNVPSIWMRRLSDHFGEDPNKLPVVAAEYPFYEHASVQLALEHYLVDCSRTSELVGTGNGSIGASLNELLQTVCSDVNPSEGPVKYFSVGVGGEQTLTCVASGLYLVCEGSHRLAIKVLRLGESIWIEVMALQHASAEVFLRELKSLVNKFSVYRGEILSVPSSSEFSVKFARLEPLARDSLILPDGVLARIERHTIQFAEHRELILSAGLPLKRGILLYGAPGTGKTLTIRYLLGMMSGRTTIMVHGRGLDAIGQVCGFARNLCPVTVVIEDVDLVAEDRRYSRTNPLLVDLLNQMDGLANDCDILFLLTTNRAKVLEPALRSRPGRIDQAIEVPLPDEICRQRLFELYARGIRLEVGNLEKLVERTKGANAAFIRELVRKAVLLAAIDGSGLQVRGRHFDDALQEMVVTGGELGKSLVGFRCNGDE